MTRPIKKFTKEHLDLCLFILMNTDDGDRLHPGHLKILENVVNGWHTDRELAILKGIKTKLERPEGYTAPAPPQTIWYAGAECELRGIYDEDAGDTIDDMQSLLDAANKKFNRKACFTHQPPYHYFYIDSVTEAVEEIMKG